MKYALIVQKIPFLSNQLRNAFLYEITYEDIYPKSSIHFDTIFSKYQIFL